MKSRHKTTVQSKPLCLERTGGNSRSGAGSRILDWMRAHRSPVHGDELARRFRVSRQCLVQDVAILRAGGQEILGTPRGYRLPDAARQRAQSDSRLQARARTNGRRIEHSGRPRSENSRRDRRAPALWRDARIADDRVAQRTCRIFSRKVNSSHASLLSSLTDGVHLHTVEASRPEMITRAKEQLRERGISAEMIMSQTTQSRVTREQRIEHALFRGASLTLENPEYAAARAFADGYAFAHRSGAVRFDG